MTRTTLFDRQGLTVARLLLWGGLTMFCILLINKCNIAVK
jgi:hypothetical protein